MLSADERVAAEILGYSAESWEHGDPPACSLVWQKLDDEQRAAATALGYEKVIWDAEYDVDPHTPGKDKEAWIFLTIAEKHAATALGYERTSWDEGWQLERCERPWAALNQWNRCDAAVLGYTPELWDAEIEGEEGAAPSTTLKTRALDNGLSSTSHDASSAGTSSGADPDSTPPCGGASSDSRHGPNACLPILDVRRPDSNPLHTHDPRPPRPTELRCGNVSCRSSWPTTSSRSLACST